MSQPIIRTSDMRKKMGDTTTESAVFGLPQSQDQGKQRKGQINEQALLNMAGEMKIKGQMERADER